MVYISDIKDLNKFVRKSGKKSDKSTVKLLFFEFAFLIMRNPFFSTNLEFLSGMIRIVQLVSIPLSDSFVSVWSDSEVFQVVSTFINYFNLLPLLKNTDEIFLVFYYIGALIVILLVALAVVSMHFAVSQQSSEGIAFYLFKFLLIICSSFLYVPFLRVFLAFFWKKNGEYVMFKQYALTDPFRLIHCIAGVILSLLLMISSILIQSVLFEIKYSKERKYAKTTSKLDIEVILGQTLLVIFTMFLENDWVIMFCSSVVSIILLKDYISQQPYFYSFLTKMFMAYYTIFGWANLVLVICKVFSDFNGGLVLFGVGIPFIVLSCFFSHDQSIECIMKTINKCETKHVALKHIQYLLEIVETKEGSKGGRRAKILLDGYIQIFEETCHIINCPLYKFLHSSEDKKYKILLYQHVESIYRIAIKRYPNYVKLVISFANFLNEVMNKKTMALEVLNTNFAFTSSLEDEFLIYRYKRDIEEDTYGQKDGGSNAGYGSSKSNSKTNDNLLNVAYKSKFLGFKKEMTNVSTLYVDFWNLLMTEGSEAEKLLKLNNVGTKITEKVEECEVLFQKLRKMNNTDYEVLFYYSEFLRNVTNRTDLADKYKEQYEKIVQSTNDDDKEDTFLSVINTKDINKTDEYQYLIISANSTSFGLIQNISLSMCVLLGYTKDELVGKHLNILIPEIMHKQHNQILYNTLNEFKHKELDITNVNSEMPTFKTIHCYILDKAKFIIDVSLRVAIFHSEVYGNAFVANTVETTGISAVPSESKVCYVLTSPYFTIQTFTTTAVSILGFNTNYMNVNLDITKLIRQFSEEVIKQTIEQDAQTVGQKVKIKKEIAEKRYANPLMIHFRNIVQNDASATGNNNVVEGVHSSVSRSGISHKETTRDNRHKKTGQKKGGISNITQSNMNMMGNMTSNQMGMSTMNVNMTSFGELKEDNLMLCIKKIILNGDTTGYLFRFEKLFANDRGSSKLSETNAALLNVFGTSSAKMLNDGKTPTPELLDKLEDAKDMDVVQTLGITENNNMKFVIDPSKMSYVMNKSTIEESREKLRNLAMDKIKKEGAELRDNGLNGVTGTDNEDSSSSGSGGSESSESESDSEEGSEGSGKRQKSKESGSEEDEEENIASNIKGKDKKGNQKSDDVFYKVNMNNIRMMRYDFRKKVFFEQQYDKVSQVDISMFGLKDKTSSDSNEQESGKGGVTDSIITDGATGTTGQDSVSKSTAHQIIEYTLSKKETQPALLRLKVFSGSSFLLILIIVVVWFVFVNISFTKLKQNFRMIQLSYNAIMNSLYAIYDVRQLTLLNNENYTGYMSSRVEDFEYTKNDIANIYVETHQIMKDITTSSISLKEEYQSILSDNKVTISIYDMNKDIKNSYFMTLQSAIIEGNTALRHIIVDLYSLDQFIPLETNIYFYLENSCKGIYNAERQQVEAFESELTYKIQQYRKYMILVVLSNIPISLICYFFIVRYFRRTTKRKEQYLIIFFDIGINVIKCLLQNCEDFSNKIQCESIIDFYNEEVSMENELAEEAGEGGNTKTALEQASMNVKSKKNHVQHTDVSASENIHLEILLALFFVVIIIINFLIYFFTNRANKSFSSYIDIFIIQIENNDEYLMLMINIREYCFGTLSYMGFEGTDVGKYLENFQQKVLASSGNNDENTYSSIFATVIFDLYQGNVCETNKQYIEIPEGSTCEDILYNSSKYGFTVLLSTYFLQLRTLKSHMDYLYLFGEENKFVYNMTLTGTEYLQRNLPTDKELQNLYYSLHPIIVFNSEPFLSVLRAYRFIIKGCISGLFTTFTAEINSYITQNQLIMNICLGMFVVFVLTAYFGVWVRYEQKLNNTIYKTKNMLSIIPVSILANIPSVFKVLEINCMINKNNLEKDKPKFNPGLVKAGTKGPQAPNAPGANANNQGQGNAKANEGGNKQEGGGSTPANAAGNDK